MATKTATPKPTDTPTAPVADTAAKSTTNPAVTIAGIGALPQPERESKRGSTSQFPFSSLTQPGMAFGVKDRTKASLSQIISNRNRKSLVDKTDQNGNIVYKTTETINADGSKSMIPTQEAEKVPSAKFYAVDVTDEYRKQHLADKPEFADASVLVFREI